MEETIKNLLIAILVVLIVNTVFVATLIFNGGSSSTKNTTNTVSEESTEYDTSKVESIDYEKFKELYNGSEDSLVLFARSTCGYCVQFMPILNAAIEENNLKVYYVDITTMSEDNVNDIKALDSFFEENYGYTPTLVVVSNGKVVANNVGYMDSDELNTFLTNNSFIG